MISYFGRVFTHAGVLAVFKPRRGCLKIPVAPTGKLKLHVFPLRRAKENKGFSPFNPHAPFKKGSILNFLTSLFGRFWEDFKIYTFRKKRKTGTEIFRTGQKTVCFYYFLKR